MVVSRQCSAASNGNRVNTDDGGCPFSSAVREPARKNRFEEGLAAHVGLPFEIIRLSMGGVVKVMSLGVRGELAQIHGNDSHLLKDAETIGLYPGAHDLASLQEVDRNAGVMQGMFCGREASESAEMRARPCPAYGDAIPFGDHVFDDETNVGHAGSKALDQGSKGIRASGPVRSYEVLAQEIGQEVDVALVDTVIVNATYGKFVVIDRLW